MNIFIDTHTLERASERGASQEEIIETIEKGVAISGKRDRLGKGKVFEFNSDWNGKHYLQKKIEVFYVVEDEAIITVTVYVYYGKWET